jgi:hypothetical protein
MVLMCLRKMLCQVATMMHFSVGARRNSLGAFSALSYPFFMMEVITLNTSIQESSDSTLHTCFWRRMGTDQIQVIDVHDNLVHNVHYELCVVFRDA